MLMIPARGSVDAAAMRKDVQMFPNWTSTGLVGSAAYDDLMLILVRADFTADVALLLSFLAVVLGFDAVCGEREQGTLKLLLTNPVPRSIVIAAKRIGGALPLWVPLILAFVVSVLILLANPDITLSGDDAVRLLGIPALSCLVLFQVTNSHSKCDR